MVGWILSRAANAVGVLSCLTIVMRLVDQLDKRASDNLSIVNEYETDKNSAGVGCEASPLHVQCSRGYDHGLSRGCRRSARSVGADRIGPLTKNGGLIGGFDLVVLVPAVPRSVRGSGCSRSPRGRLVLFVP
jgi:hypothetical protein